MEASPSPRVVLVHDWLTGMRGGEKCLEVVCRRWPKSHLYTLLHRPGSVSKAIEALDLKPSLLQHLPQVHRYYRYLLPILPAIVETWRLPACDLVVSFSHCVAKSAKPPRGAPHVCLCFTPMRYAWHMREAYFGREMGIKARALEHILGVLREWDRRTAARVTHFIAISRTVQKRIVECYGRPSTVIYPPVDTDFYCPAPVPREDYLLAVSAFAPYKRLDQAIEACNRLRQRLVIIGSGQDEKRLRALAGPTIHFLGWQSDTAIRDHMRRCRALIFPGEEDFGIVPVEANSCGTPVIAFGRGGATETVVPPTGREPPTGVWIQEQNLDSLVDAIHELESRVGDFSPAWLHSHAQRFSGSRFSRELFAYLHQVLRPSSPPARLAA
jgi:glycosyltransferase involved in cell wall biosynthesis